MALTTLKPWNWTQDINDVFKEAKKVITEKVHERVKLFDPMLHLAS